jgi:hypothetical protein
MAGYVEPLHRTCVELYTVTLDRIDRGLPESERYMALLELLAQCGFEDVGIKRRGGDIIELNPGSDENAFGLVFNHLLTSGPLPAHIIDSAKRIGYGVRAAEPSYAVD